MVLEKMIKFVLFGTLSIVLGNSKSIPSQKESSNCDPNMPYLSVGDFNLTERNHNLKIEKHENILVYVSTDLELCPHCCKAEGMLRELEERVFRNSTHHSGLGSKDIKIARYAFPRTFFPKPKEDEPSDIVVPDSDYGHNPSSGDTWFSEKYQVNNLPAFILLRKGQPFYFSNANDLNRLVSHMSRIVQPVQDLETIRMVDQFLEETIEDMTGRKIVRVKALLLMEKSEREDYEEAVKGFYHASEVMHWREDVVFAEVSDKNLLNEIFKKYSTKLFNPDYGLSSIVVWRNYNRFEYHNFKEGVTAKLDLEKVGGRGKEALGRWLAQNSIGLVEEMNSLN